MSENSIEFSLSNSEQRDSWLNSGHRTLDADTLSIRKANSKPELSQLLFISVRQRELIRVLTILG